jgi:hypothetical protein
MAANKSVVVVREWAFFNKEGTEEATFGITRLRREVLEANHGEW